jgi:hypothetical protein
MRKHLPLVLLALSLAFFHGCSTAPKSEAASAPTQHYYLNPAVEFGACRTYGFLQVTAVRYVTQNAVDGPHKPQMPWDKGEWTLHHKNRDGVVIHHTDELIWRVIADEMEEKGYKQVEPTKADLLVVYYGGPRPQTAMDGIKIKDSPFDRYFAQNELMPNTFFVDVIDTKQEVLAYRGWDSRTFAARDPQPDQIIRAAEDCIDLFPSARR